MPNSRDLSEQRVGMLLDHPGRHPDEILDRLRGALGHGNVGEPDHEGFFEVGVAAASFESALEVVWNAVASAGVDDDVRFAEHPDLPEHWRRRAGGGAQRRWRARWLAAGAVGTTALNAATYVDIALRGRAPSEVPAHAADRAARRIGIGLCSGPAAEHRRAGAGALLGYATGLGAGGDRAPRRHRAGGRMPGRLTARAARPTRIAACAEPA